MHSLSICPEWQCQEVKNTFLLPLAYCHLHIEWQGWREGWEWDCTNEVSPHTACLVVDGEEAAQRLAQGVVHTIVPLDVPAQAEEALKHAQRFQLTINLFSLEVSTQGTLTCFDVWFLLQLHLDAYTGFSSDTFENSCKTKQVVGLTRCP